MSITCPRCGGPVAQATNAGAGGAVGALLASAFSSYHCSRCGKLKTSEFPPEVRSRMRTQALILVLVVVLLLGGLIALVIYSLHLP
jgi:hypothetical protein